MPDFWSRLAVLLYILFPFLDIAEISSVLRGVICTDEIAGMLVVDSSR